MGHTGRSFPSFPKVALDLEQVDVAVLDLGQADVAGSLRKESESCTVRVEFSLVS